MSTLKCSWRRAVPFRGSVAPPQWTVCFMLLSPGGEAGFGGRRRRFAGESSFTSRKLQKVTDPPPQCSIKTASYGSARDEEQHLDPSFSTPPRSLLEPTDGTGRPNATRRGRRRYRITIYPVDAGGLSGGIRSGERPILERTRSDHGPFLAHDLGACCARRGAGSRVDLGGK